MLLGPPTEVSAARPLLRARAFASAPPPQARSTLPQVTRGREEQAECVAFLQQRAAADLAYAASFARHRLGGRSVAHLADLRAAALPGGAGTQ